MAHGLNSVIKRGVSAVQCKPEGKTGVGSRRIFSPQFKLQVLDSYRNDADCKGNQRATARKYGIHRRQIQKWLQVEATLRNGVGGKQQQHLTQTVKCEVSLSGHRQRDDETSALRSASLASEARVPALEPPAGWRTHHQAPVCVPDPASPMDLSLKRPVPSPLPSPPSSVYLPAAGPSPCLRSHQPDVWDLSTKSNNKRKAEDEGASTASPKPVKLFKPYLDDLRDGEESVSPPARPTPASPQPVYCCQPALSCSQDGYFINNNNNNHLCCDIMKSPEYHPAYKLHDLQSNTTSFYHYPYYHPDSSPTYHPYEDPVLVSAGPLKRRQSYSLDFKFSAIDCFYQDTLCKGNPRAVANKYHHGHLGETPRSRSEGLRETHAVR